MTIKNERALSKEKLYASPIIFAIHGDWGRGKKIGLTVLGHKIRPIYI
jgi:hypothetical protein